MSDLIKSKNNQDDDDDNIHPLQRPNIRSTVGRALEKAYNRLAFDTEDWLMEMRATGQAAALSGEFGDSFKFYELLGRAIGAVADPASQQHLHLHNQPARVEEMSTEELLARREALMAQQAREQAKQDIDDQLSTIL